jgi:hypothetical protein
MNIPLDHGLQTISKHIERHANVAVVDEITKKSWSITVSPQVLQNPYLFLSGGHKVFMGFAHFNSDRASVLAIVTLKNSSINTCSKRPYRFIPARQAQSILCAACNKSLLTHLPAGYISFRSIMVPLTKRKCSDSLFLGSDQMMSGASDSRGVCIASPEIILL